MRSEKVKPKTVIGLSFALFGALLLGGAFLFFGCGGGGDVPVTTTTTTTTVITTTTAAPATTSTTTTTTTTTTSTVPAWTWTQKTTAAFASGGRAYLSGAVFAGKMWVIGGKMAGGTYTNEVWSSSDGETWDLAGLGGFSGRMMQASVVFKGKLWVIGGQATYQATSEVWSSVDGLTWEAASVGQIDRVCDLAALVYNSKLWVIGGNQSEDGEPYSKVWSSDDGVTFTEVTASAAFGNRCRHAGTVQGGKMWLLGGNEYPSKIWDTTWYSTDGSGWTEAGNIRAAAATPTGNSATAREWHRAVTATVNGSSQILVTGGYNYYGSINYYFDDLWLSADGAAWSTAECSARYAPRFAHVCLVYNNKLWVIGGKNQKTPAAGFLNDVWSAPLP